MSAETNLLLDPLLGAPAVSAIFSDRGRVQAMLDFEAALAAAEAYLGLIPATAAPAIAAKCKAELFDPAALAKAAVPAGNPAIPLVKRLTTLVAQEDEAASRFVHWGATSQDVMDTGLVLQLRAALTHIDRDLMRLADGLAALAAAHRQTVMIGRTWLQQALPITFGLKAAGWLDAVERHRTRLAEARPRLLVVQFGGAAGTLASLGERGLQVAEVLAQELGLELPAVPWHTQRDRLVELATTLGLVLGTLGKIARDVSLLMQTEIAEAFEPAAEGRGGSSTMPHKRNPVTAAIVLAAAIRAPGLVSTLLSGMVQEHERGLGGWHAEWVTLPELVILAAGALAHLADIIPGLELDPDRMRTNLDVTHGLIMAEAVMMALGAKLGRLVAHDRIEAACRQAVAERRHLRDVLGNDATVMNELGPEALDRLLDPSNYLGVAEEMIDRVLAVHRR